MFKTTKIIIAILFVLITASSCGGGGGTVVNRSPASGVTQENAATTQESSTTQNTAIVETTETTTENGATDTTTVPDVTTEPETVIVTETPEDITTQGAVDTSTETVSDITASLSMLASDKTSFTLVVLPDSQHVTVDYPDIFISQFQWIYDNIDAKNIAFVLHEGDVTHYNNETGWINASLTYEMIDSKVPVAIAVGNHDMEFPLTYDTTLLNTYFPVSRYAGYDYFGGSYPEGTMDNSYHLFSAAGQDWLVITLRYSPSQEILSWANGVVDAYPERKVIVVTHAFVNESDEIGNDARNLWNRFIKKHANISLVFNGHYTDGQTGRAELTGDNGNSIQAMFANYQKSSYGGSGYIRLVTITPSAGTIDVKTYSPWLDDYKTDAANQFTITGF